MTFVSILVVCSASWIIKNFKNEFLSSDTIDNTYYLSAVGEDTLSDYFTTGDTYNGTVQKPTITATGAKALYGNPDNLSDADLIAAVAGKYEAVWQAGEYINGDPIPTDEVYKEKHHGISAGKHYYRITDTGTGAVICYKHTVDIPQDTLAPVEATASNIYLVSDTVSYQITWRGKVSGEVFGTETRTETVVEDFFTGTAQTSKRGPSSANAENLSAEISSATIVTKYDDTSDVKILFYNNYSNASNPGTATFSYDILSTCKVGTRNSKYYGTLCQAIRTTSSGTIYAQASFSYTYNGTQKTYTAAHTHTAAEVGFTHQICCDCTLASKVNLVIDYQQNTSTDPTDYYTKQTYGNAYLNPAKFCKNQVSLDAKLKINGSLIIGGVFNAGGGGNEAGQTCGNYGQLNLTQNGELVANSGGKVECFGFIKGWDNNQTEEDDPSKIVFNSGSYLRMPFVLYEFRGGSISTGMQKSDKTFYSCPFNRFAFANIDGAYTIHGGATTEAMAALTASSMAADATASVISTETTSLITLLEGARVEINYKNEERIDNLCGKMYLKFYGGATLNTLEISKWILLSTITVSSRGAYLPLSYLHDIELHNGYYNLKGQNVKILPGGRVFVAEDAQVDASKIILYESFPPLGQGASEAFPTKTPEGGKVVLAGTMNATCFGGKIESASVGAKLTITEAANVDDSYDIADEKVTTDYKFGDYYYTKTSADATGEVAINGTLTDNTPLSANTTYTSYSYATDKYAWSYQKTINVKYHNIDGGKASDGTVPVDISKTLGSHEEGVYLSLPTLEKAYYTFDGWYTDANFTTKATEKTVYESVDVYAKWTINSYTVTFVGYVYDGFKPEPEIAVPTNKITFTVNDTVTLPQPTGAYTFNGWYGSADCKSNKISSYTISGEQLLSLSDEGKIYGLWTSVTYEFNFKVPEPGENVSYGINVDSEERTPAQLNEKLPIIEDIATREYYFSHWTYNGTRVDTYGDVVNLNADGSPYELVANWLQKYTLNVKGNSEANKNAISTEGTFYLTQDTLDKGVTLSELFSSFNVNQYDDSRDVNKYFKNWLKGSEPIESINSADLDASTKSLELTSDWGTKATVTFDANTGNNGDNGLNITNPANPIYLVPGTYDVSQISEFSEAYAKLTTGDTNTQIEYYYKGLKLNGTALGEGITTFDIVDGGTYSVTVNWTPKEYVIIVSGNSGASVSNKVITLSGELFYSATQLPDGASLQLSDILKKYAEMADDYDADPLVNKYFTGEWTRTVDSVVEPVTSISNAYFANGPLTLTAKWDDKFTIEVTADGDTVDTGYGGSSGYVNYSLYITETNVGDVKGEVTDTTERTTYYIKPNHWFYFVINKKQSDKQIPSDLPTYGSPLKAVNEKGYSYDFPQAQSSCIVEGTLITLADGTQKKVEDLTKDDIVLIFNHSTGKMEAGYVAMLDHLNVERKWTRVVNLVFSNGEALRIVWNHGVFDVTLNEYVFICEDNMLDFIGHEFYSTYYNGTEFVTEIVTMTDAYVTEEFVKIYNPTTVWHMNYFANGILNVTAAPEVVSGHMNYFELDENMKYDEEKMQADIEKYGLYTYEDFEDILTYEQFNALPFAYLKVSVGKGMITWDGILSIVEYINTESLLE